MNLSIQYRGHLTSCNYECAYCPFAKRTETKAQLQRDEAAVIRFTQWIAGQTEHHWKILFTPWGEGLVRPWYRRAIQELSHLPHVDLVATQTNLACGLDWISDCRVERLAFWATFHPTQVETSRFLSKVQRLHKQGVRLSVGMVAVPEFIERIVALRRALPDAIYLWINAQQPRTRPYSLQEVALLTEIDPQFKLTLHKLRSLSKPCRTGETIFTVDGDGNMRRCHFVADLIGNIYDSDWQTALQPRLCPNQFCHCFLGKAQLQAETLDDFFGDHLLERIPEFQFAHAPLK